jgi:hypothetical protein
VTTDDDLNEFKSKYWQPQLDFINAIGGITRLVDGALSFTKDTDLSFDPADFGYTKPDDWIWCTEDQRYYGEFLTVSRSCSTDPCRALLAVEGVHGLRLTVSAASRASQCNGSIFAHSLLSIHDVTVWFASTAC